ncbi:MAG: topoisomerase DNA-binding C4 zinc finger domain-containing protein, partial [Clostridia bacterium]|nr:topoisomerase DNA-binding C4 zinc finger domain-containing protein [Clostridia bacterium]
RFGQGGNYVGQANPNTGVTAEQDEAYMRAAMSGDRETAGRMVREMYERNGWMHVYRGEPEAPGSWTEVIMDKFKASGMFASPDISTAQASEYTHSYAREDLKTKPLSYGDEMPVLQEFADGVAQRIGRGLNLMAESYYMDDEGNTFTAEELKPEQKFTKPPARFTESSLVKAMEEKGIGRPATYAQTVNVIMSRSYAEKEGKALKATELGKKVVDMLIKFFPNIMDVGFTAAMEDRLDDIEYGGKVWQNVVGEFYTDFEKDLRAASSDNYVDHMPDIPSDVKCDKCGANMVIKTGKYGKFLACPNFPKCKNTKPYNEHADEFGLCPKCGKHINQLKTKTGKTFYGCEDYPNCDWHAWDLPAGEKCPNCGTDMIMKIYSVNKIIKCAKCNYSKKIPLKKAENQAGEGQNQAEVNADEGVANSPEQNITENAE